MSEHVRFLPNERLPDPANVSVLCLSLISFQMVIEHESEDVSDAESARSHIDAFENADNL